MPRTKVPLSTVAILCLALAIGSFFAAKKQHLQRIVSQTVVEPPDDGTRAAVLLSDENGDHWAFIDRRGKVVFSLPSLYPIDVYLPSLKHGSSFSEGLAAVNIKFEFGYIDTAGKMVISPKFFAAEPFRQHRAQVTLPTRHLPCGFIDTAGKMVIPTKYSLCQNFSEGLAAVNPLGYSKWGFIDLSGKMVIPPRFDSTQDFSEGLAVVTVNGKDGYIDHTGKIVIPADFHDALPFSEGLARVAHGSHNSRKFVYIDKTGTLAIPADYDDAESFSEGLAAVLICPPSGCAPGSGQPLVASAKWGYIDTSGKMVIPRQFSQAKEFSEGLAAVVADDYRPSGLYINKKGEVVIAASLLHSRFQHGLAAVFDNGSAGFIDKTGRFVIPPQFISAMPFSR